MATFLQLSQELRRLTGIQGTGPTDVTNAAGIELQLVNYVKNAWIGIQNNPKQWRWMIRDWLQSAGPDTPLQTIAATNDYSLTAGETGVESVIINTFRSYLTATGVSDRQRLNWMPWRRFQSTYGLITSTDRRPITVTQKPTGELRFYPRPDAIYSIEFETFKTPQVLSANADIPEMPVRFHQLIVYEALKRFGKNEDAPELIKAGEEEGGSDGNEGRPASGMWRSMMWDQEVREMNSQREDTQMTVVPV